MSIWEPLGESSVGIVIWLGAIVCFVIGALWTIGRMVFGADVGLGDACIKMLLSSIGLFIISVVVAYIEDFIRFDRDRDRDRKPK